MTSSTITDKYTLNRVKVSPSPSASQNACKLCAPLGASLVFKGIEGAVPLLHGSQGCSTYIRRYLISHFKEPIDIACSNFGEQTAVFGGGANLKLALDNIISQYDPTCIGVATTCLAETIGDDVPMFIKTYQKSAKGPLPPMVHVSTPSYQGTHAQGFHNAVAATVRGLISEEKANVDASRINLFPGMLSPADLRHLKQITADFGLTAMVLPDYSRTLDGPLWDEYHRIPCGGTPVSDIVSANSALASIELGRALAKWKDTAALYLAQRFDVTPFRLGLPIGIRQTDKLLQTLAEISARPIPERYAEQRGRLLDALVDGHKYVNNKKAIIYGEADLVAGMADFLSEIGILPVVCGTGDRNSHLAATLQEILDEKQFNKIQVVEGVDFVDIENLAKEARPDLIIGHSKGYSLSRKLGIPLVRIGFPIHDRVGAARLLHVGYEGAMALFDRIANTLLERRQADSEVGYTYM